MKDLEVRQKYSAARHIFNPFLSVLSDDDWTLRLMLDINIPWYLYKVRPFDRDEETAALAELNWITLSGCHILVPTDVGTNRGHLFFRY